MACTRFKTPSPCPVCGASRGALPASHNDASIVQCAICGQDLGRFGNLKQELSDQARRHSRALNLDPVRTFPAVTLRW